MQSLAASLRRARPPDWLNRVLDPATVADELRERIPDVVPGAHDLVDLRLQDVRARRAWSLRFEADTVTAEGVRHVVLFGERPVPGTDPRHRPGMVLLPGLGLSVVALGSDPDLPALPTLTDPAVSRPLLETALREIGHAPPRIATVRSRRVRYKPGHRATVVHDLTFAADADPDWPARVVTKTYSDDRGASTLGWMRALWESGLGRGSRPRLAEPLGWMADRRTLVQRALPGSQTLADVALSRPTPAHSSVESLLEGTVDGLVALHRCGVVAGPPRTAIGKLERCRQRLLRVRSSYPARVCDDAESLLDSLASLAGPDREQAVPVHGAFRPGQVLVDGSDIGFLDFDGFGQGEPALDTGTFVARLAELETDEERRTELLRSFLARYREQAPLPTDRAALWVGLALVTGAVSSWSRARTDRAVLLLDLFDEALTSPW